MSLAFILESPTTRSALDAFIRWSFSCASQGQFSLFCGGFLPFGVLSSGAICDRLAVGESVDEAGVHEGEAGEIGDNQSI